MNNSTPKITIHFHRLLSIWVNNDKQADGNPSACLHKIAYLKKVNECFATKTANLKENTNTLGEYLNWFSIILMPRDSLRAPPGY